tara:strand:+ start:163 stop:738 length:576 start_codon:yes stop_codon:yes gene_type:complete
MMLKNTLHTLISILLLSSCQEINITKEVNYTFLLDSLVQSQTAALKKIDTTRVTKCLEKSAERLYLFELKNLDPFQKQWLHHDKIAYQKIEENFSDFNYQLDSISKEFAYSKKQLASLKKDLVHRHLKKNKFAAYLSDEQKILGTLNILSENLRNTFTTNLTHFDSLESRLHGIFIQLNALQSEHGKLTEN